MQAGEKTYVDQEPESNEPSNGDDEINRPVDEATREWKEPEESEEDRESSDNLSVDEALLGPV